MKMISKHSSHIDAVGYDAGTQELHVRFKSGKTYAYMGVPRKDADFVLNGESPGTALHDFIKGIYDHKQV